MAEKPLEIIYEDNHLLVVNKPAGILTQPSGTEQMSLEGIAKEWLRKKYKKPGNVFLHAVHRIDKPVSGLVLFAKTSKALSRLQHIMRTKQAYKQYVSIVENTFNESEGTLEDYLFHDDFCARVVTKNTAEAKFARLHYKMIEVRKGFAILEIVLDTGRYHQIRVQLSHRKHSIVGDVRYGSQYPYRAHAIMLHHQKLQIPHPISGAIITFEAPIPQDWEPILT